MPPPATESKPGRNPGTFRPNDPRINRTRPGPGRPEEAFRRRCRQALRQGNGIGFVMGVMAGTECEVVPVKDQSGEVIGTATLLPRVRDRLLAFELLADRGYGKPPMAVSVEDVTPDRRPTYDELLARIAERLPRLIAILPLERRELARLFQERQEIDKLLAARALAPGDPTP